MAELHDLNSIVLYSSSILLSSFNIPLNISVVLKNDDNTFYTFCGHCFACCYRMRAWMILQTGRHWINPLTR